MLSETTDLKKDNMATSFAAEPTWIENLAITISLSAALWAFTFSVYQIVGIFNATCVGMTDIILKSLEDKLTHIYALTFGPLLEEYICRKLLLNFLEKIGINVTLSIFISATAFSLGHYTDFDQPSVHFIVLAQISHFSAGFLYAIIYIKTKNILYPVAAHITYNLLVIAPKGWLYCDATNSNFLISSAPYVASMVVLFILMKNIAFKSDIKTLGARRTKSEKTTLPAK